MPHRFSRWAAGATAALGANLLLGTAGVPALYPTQAEAEKAAKLHFNCSGAHRMGQQWMPCAKHGDAQGAPHSH